MIPRMQTPPPAELDAIHAATLRLLEQVGVAFPSHDAQELLAAAGALVNAETGVVKIPAHLVEQALATAPRDILLAGRDPARDVRCSGDETYLTLDGTGAGMTALASMLMDPDLLVGAGMHDGAQMLSLPKILLDCELFRQCRRVREGMIVDDAHLMVDVVADIGPGGHFLKAKQTRRFMRAGELYVPRLLLREPYDTWSIEKKGELERAVDAVEAILAEHRPKPLPAGAEESILGTIAAAGRELGGR